MPLPLNIVNKTFYQGLVATRNRMAKTAVTDSATKMMGRTAHVATTNISDIRVAIGNFYVVGGGSILDYGIGDVATVTASIEYPSGSFTQLKFSGSTSVVIADADLEISDAAYVSIPSGETFWVRVFWSNPAGVIHNSFINTTLGEVTFWSNSATDLTMGGTITNNSSVTIPTIAVIGTTLAPSVIIVGASLGTGFNDTETSSGADAYDGKVGIVARSMGSLPFLNISVGGSTALDWETNGSARNKLITYGSSLICTLGRNDIYAYSQTDAQTLTSLQAVYALSRSGQKIWQTTQAPNTTSSNGWISPNDQALLSAPHEAYRVSLNASIRAGLSNVTGYFDVDATVGIGSDYENWLVSPSPPYSDDGVHCNTDGYQFIQDSGVIDTSNL